MDMSREVAECYPTRVQGNVELDSKHRPKRGGECNIPLVL